MRASSACVKLSKLRAAVFPNKRPSSSTLCASREAIAAAKPVWEAVEREGEALEGRGRVLLRPSGTEPLVRVMVEHEDEKELHRIANALASEVERELGIA